MEYSDGHLHCVFVYTGGMQLFDAGEFVALLSGFLLAHGSAGYSGESQGSAGHSGGESQACKILQVVFLNACHTEAVGAQLREHGAECVVCWRTSTHDDAACLFSVEFFRVLAERGFVTQQPTPLQSARDDYIAAFDAAVEAVRSAKRRTRKQKFKYEFADPEAPNATTRGSLVAAGIPVLLCNGAAAGMPWRHGDGAAAGEGVRLPVARLAEAHPPPLVRALVATAPSPMEVNSPSPGMEGSGTY